MKTFSLLTLLVASSSLVSAATAIRTYSAGAQSFAINGTACPEVAGWSGGDIAGTVTQSSLGGVTKKHISSVSYDPIIVDSGLPLSPVLADSLANFLSGKNTPQTLTLTTADTSGKTESTLQATNAVIEEVQFPKLDGSSKETVRVTFIFRADSVKPTAPETLAAGPKTGRNTAVASNFRIAIDGLPSSRIASLEGFSIKSTTAGKPAAAALSSPNISNLTLAISTADRAGWNAWRDSFLLQGNSQEAAEKSGTIELLSVDLKTPIFTLKLSNIGLIRLSTPPVEGEAVSRIQADLYVESASIPSAPATTTKAVIEAPAELIKRPVIKP